MWQTDRRTDMTAKTALAHSVARVTKWNCGVEKRSQRLGVPVHLSITEHLCWKMTQYFLILIYFLQRDAMRMRGLCCCPVSVCPSVCHIDGLYRDGWRSSNFFLGPVEPYHFFDLKRRSVPNSKGNPFNGVLNTRGWENLRFSSEIAVYIEDGTR